MFGRAVHVVVADAAAATSALPAFLATRGISCDRVEPVRPSLEDVFVSLVRREGGAVAG
jgi:ABC-2 type transport system ATP-binding protein